MPASGDEAPLRRLRVTGATLTDVGLLRALNEDTILFVAPEEASPEGKVGFLALVADGMGGHAAGEVASALTAKTIQRVVYSGDASPPKALREAFETANRTIRQYSFAHPETAGMGTTCTTILIRDGLLWLAHIGDSRAYLLHEGALEQLSDDQTLHARLMREGLMTAQEAATAPGRNYLLQALGPSALIEPTIWAQGRKLRAGDTALLCSDGLYTLVEDWEIARVLRAVASPEEACRKLIDRALAAGGLDNVSVGVFRIMD